MIEGVVRVGPTGADLLDSLQRRSMTAVELAEDTGRHPRAVESALEPLRKAGLVWPRQPRVGPYTWSITKAGQDWLVEVERRRKMPGPEKRYFEGLTKAQADVLDSIGSLGVCKVHDVRVDTGRDTVVVHKAFRRLCKLGYVWVVGRVPGPGGTHRVYRITDAGRQWLKREEAA